MGIRDAGATKPTDIKPRRRSRPNQVSPVRIARGHSARRLAEDGTAERSSCDGRHIPDLRTTEKGRGGDAFDRGPPTGITGTHTDATADDDNNNNDDDSDINHHDEDLNRAAATGDGCSGPSNDGGGRDRGTAAAG